MSVVVRRTVAGGAAARRQAPPGAHPFRPQLLTLEERLLPAFYTVSPTDQIALLAGTAAVSSAAPQQVLFVENAVAGYQALTSSVKPGVDVVILDSRGDGLKQISAFLGQHPGYQTLSLVSHGDAGTLALGSDTLTMASLAGNAPELKAIGSSLSGPRQVLLYGCDVAAGSVGQAFVSAVAADAGAAVAASTHLVGSAALGGSWNLDYRVGTVTAALPFDPSGFTGVLPIGGDLSNAQLNSTLIQAGGNVGITWSGATQGNAPVNILLSINGSTFPVTIVSNLPNDNAYTWNVPANLTTIGVKIEVVDTGNTSDTTTSSAVALHPATTPILSTFAGNGTAGSTGDGSLAVAAELNSPTDVAVDSAGDLFIADDSNELVREVNAVTGIITTVAGNGTLGSIGDNGPATSAELHYPDAVAVDSQGDLFIADSFNNRVRAVNLSTGVITTVAGNGTQGDTGDGQQASSAELFDPQGLAVDNLGHLFISDSGNDRIREVNLSTGVITTVAGNGTQGDTGDGQQATSAELTNAFGVTVDSQGDLFLADYGAARVREVNLSTGIITTVAGNGTEGSTGDQSQATSAELDFPTGVLVDGQGDLLISDNGGAVRG